MSCEMIVPDLPSPQQTDEGDSDIEVVAIVYNPKPVNADIACISHYKRPKKEQPDTITGEPRYDKNSIKEKYLPKCRKRKYRSISLGDKIEVGPIDVEALLLKGDEQRKKQRVSENTTVAQKEPDIKETVSRANGRYQLRHSLINTHFVPPKIMQKEVGTEKLSEEDLWEVYQFTADIFFRRYMSCLRWLKKLYDKFYSDLDTNQGLSIEELLQEDISDLNYALIYRLFPQKVDKKCISKLFKTQPSLFITMTITYVTKAARRTFINWTQIFRIPVEEIAAFNRELEIFEKLAASFTRYEPGTNNVINKSNV